MEPRLGLYDLPNEEYQADPAVSKSKLDDINDCARRYWHKHINPDYQEDEPSEDKILGSAIHAGILEPDLFTAKYLHLPEGLTRSHKEGKALVEEAEKAGKILLSFKAYQNVLACRDAVYADPVAAPLLRQYGRAEMSLFAIHPDYGIRVKARPDYLPDDGLVIPDVKSTTDASAKAFAKSVAEFRYHVQAGWYEDVFYWAFGEFPQAFPFIAIEKKPPFNVGVWYLSRDDIMFGKRLADANLRRLIECLEQNSWPTYTENGAQQLELPRWAYF